MDNIEKKPSVLINSMLITLSLTGLTSMISNLLSGLFLIEISESFDTTIAIAGQIKTVSFIVSILFALLTSILTLKYNHKLLLQIGLISYIISSLGCFLAPNFTGMLVMFSLTGIGYALTTTMVYTLVPELFPLEKRGEAIGWIIGGMSGSYLIGAFIAPFLNGIGGWRLTFLGYMFPFSALSFFLTTFFIPSSSIESTQSSLNLKDSFQDIFSNRSALFSLLGYLLVMIPWQSIMTFNSSFFREWYKLSIGEASVFLLFGAGLYTFGSIVSGKFVNRIGRKPLTVFSLLFASLMIVVYSYLPYVWLSGGALCLGCLLVGIMDTASTGLIIEQSPMYVGVIMSLHRTVTQIGFSVGSGFGGVLLFLYGYQIMFMTLGAIGFVATAVFHFLTKDPTITS